MIKQASHFLQDDSVARPRAPKQLPVKDLDPAIRRYLAIRNVLERIIAVILFVLFLPVLLICMLIVRLTSQGPAIYSQERTGTGGRRFVMYKLRSMIHDVENISGKQWSVPGDPRVTPFGKFLRFTHLDEIPQLINVIRGEMSLIGPRPERPEFVEKLRTKIERYDERHAINPGITGLAQIYLPPDVDLDSARRKTRFDLHYLENAGFPMDARILICTALRLLSVRGGVGPKITGLDRQLGDFRRSIWAADMPAKKPVRRKLRVEDARVALPNGTEPGKNLRVDPKSELPLHIEVRRSKPTKVESGSSGELFVHEELSDLADSNDLSGFVTSN